MPFVTNHMKDHVYSGKKKPCDIVEEHFKLKDNKTGGIDSCNPKDYGGTYPPWKNDKSLVDEDGVYMPPRRQKLCVINLQHFSGTSKNDLREAFIKCAAAETFLLWHKYKKDNKGGTEAQQKLNSGIIPEEFKRQMFYTFGDYRDLCLNTDISTKTDTRKPVSIVKTNIDGIFQDRGKTPNEKREEFWKENGKEIWKGMLCALTYKESGTAEGGKIEEDTKVKQAFFGENNKGTPGTNTGTTGTSNGTYKTKYQYNSVKFSGDKTTTLEEFSKRPQFLRWMIEWSEHFCKEQKEAYGKLVTGCRGYQCNGGNAKHNKKEQCRKECESYKKLIEKWKPEWEKQSGKYDKLYKKTQKSTNDFTEEEKHVVQYLSQLRTNSGTSGANTYDSAGKYVNQKGYVSDCQQQKDFNSNTNNENYAFRSVPHEHEDKCNCKDDIPSQEKQKEYDDVCEMVKTLLENNDGINGRIESCNAKKDYPPWKNDKSLVDEDGVYMPPRRQKLCVSSLTQEGKITNKQDIRTKFINCAAIETYFAWHRYKEDNKKAEDELKSGTIPEGFRKQMYYTFGDFRDIFFGTDISSCQKIKSTSRTIKSILADNENKKKGGKHIEDYEKLQEWWNEHKEAIWKGMLCSLEKAGGNASIKSDSKYQYNSVKFSDNRNGPDLETFAKRPQFLRWFTEWGDDFCKKRKERVNELMTKCNGCIVSDSIGSGRICDKNSKECQNCTTACTEYKDWLTDWKYNYNKQKVKFNTDKGKDSDAKQSDHAYQYLKKQLEKICKSGSTNGDCEYKCMEHKSKQSPNNTDMPASLDDEPEEVKGRCTCKATPKKPEAPPPARPPPPTPPRQSLARSADNPSPRPAPPGGPQPPSGTPDAGGLARSATSPNGAQSPVQQPQPKQQTDRGVARNLPAADRKIDLPDSEEEDDEDGDEVQEDNNAEVDDDEDDDEDEDDEDLEDDAGEEEKQEVVDVVEQKEDTTEKVCKIVGDALTQENLTDACKLKYKYGKEKFPNWKCIPTKTSNEGAATGSDEKTTTSSGDTTGDNTGSSGAICVPPRRRRLYVGKLTQWAKEQTQLQTQESGETTKSQSPQTSESPQAGGDETTEAKSQETSGGEKTPNTKKSGWHKKRRKKHDKMDYY
ncbi:hypothetical protein PFTANZ_06128 [Plasmodium falciparum Tanzania (2000708)]|uniref:Duffy-binding-like domain-containing protein n=1 Tax=Plasmodium falciparum Tanzania (2000708) TaxID=1036725 RepID=A0A024VXV4_PLAFA|nr:hypothetical protein PFTANZ_06128 [Plasmodium falciparum Tanzania (2000708)]